jgi:hypothetical protein
LRKLHVLRRGLKIKVFTMMLAWGMIFMHSVIPHIHLDDCNASCYSQDHRTLKSFSHEESNLSFSSKPGDTRVCHISGFLFHQFNQDDLISGTYSLTGLCQIIPVRSYTFKDQSFSIPDNFCLSLSLRAPPLA